MSIKARLRSLAGRTVFHITREVEDELRDQHSVDLIVEAELRRAEAQALHHPTVYVDVLRSCIEAAYHSVREIKSTAITRSARSDRFARLVDAFHGSKLPPVDFAVAREIALVANRNSGLTEAYEVSRGSWSWSGDIGLNFSFTSSFGSKGRLLYNIVRFMRSECCLELGTAYGMSAFFILAALEKFGKSGHLETIEGEEPQYSLSSSLLKERFGESVACHFGYTDDVLPEVLKRATHYDFVFHDATHAGEAYIRDFHQVSQRLGSGSVFLFDDIRWDSAKYVGEELHTYEGWLAVVGDPRVKRALEIDGTLGLAFLE